MKTIKQHWVAIVLGLAVLVSLGGVTLAFAAPKVLGEVLAQSTQQPGLPQAQTTPQPWGAPGWGGGKWPGGKQPGFGRGGVMGVVATVSADQLTLTTANSQTITVTISSQTKVYLLPGQSEGKVSDIKVGDPVQVKGQSNANGALEAQWIVVGIPASRVGGQVTAVDGAKITVQVGQGTQTIVTDANTKFTLAGGQAGTLADVKVGKYVAALVQKQADGSVLAAQVTISDQPGFGRGRGMGQPGAGNSKLGGQVTAVDGAKITVQVGQGTQTIVTDANTKFTLAGGQAGTLADVKVGEAVMALIQKQADGSLLATQVVIGGQPGQRPGGGSNRNYGPRPYPGHVPYPRIRRISDTPQP